MSYILLRKKVEFYFILEKWDSGNKDFAVLSQLMTHCVTKGKVTSELRWEHSLHEIVMRFIKDNMSKIPRAWCHGTKFKCNTFNSHLFLCLLHNLMPSSDFPDRSDRSCDFENWSLHIIEVLYVLHWPSSVSWNISLSYKFGFVYHSALYVIIVSFMIEKSKGRPMFLTLYFLVLYHVYDYLIKVIWWAAWSFFYGNQMSRHIKKYYERTQGISSVY